MPKKLSVQISPNVVKQLKALRRGGGNALQAAEHAWDIINQALEGISSPKQIGRLTRYGEARMRNCIKFDLVRGYRLAAVIGKQEIRFLFVGSHDECDHWVRDNAGFEAPVYNGRAEILQVKSRADDEKPPCGMQVDECGVESDDYESELLRDLTDRELREIFRGLCGKHT